MSGASIINFEDILHFILLFYCWNQTNKWWLGLQNYSFTHKIYFQ